MYEYKNEIIKTNAHVVYKKLKDSEICSLESLDSLMNARNAEGWELLSQSLALDHSLANHNILLTFRRRISSSA